MKTRSRFRELKSRYLTERNVLSFELALTLFCIAVYIYSATGGSTLEFFILPISAILFVPFFSTLAYYREFKKTALAALSLLVIPPVLIIGGAAILYLPSRAGGLVLLMAIIYSAIASAVLPYILFAAALALHYYRENLVEER